MAASSPADTTTPMALPAIENDSMLQASKKSLASLQREAAAIRMFDDFRKQVNDAETSAKFTTLLLSPTLHLTKLCWKTFRDHVQSFPGWSTTRRPATAEEKLSRNVTRESSRYFVFVTYDPFFVKSLPISGIVASPIVPKTKTSKQSSKSLHHEAFAVETFNQFRLQNGTPTSKTTTVLLSPAVHLTQTGWKNFSKYVRSFPGWYPTRRVATEAEKSVANPTAKDIVMYFVSVTFDPAIVTALALAKDGKLPHHEAAKQKALARPVKRLAEDATPVQLEPCKKVKSEQVVFSDISTAERGNTHHVTPEEKTS